MPDSLNTLPVIIYGMNQREVTGIFLISFPIVLLICIALCVVLAVSFGSQVGMGISVALLLSMGIEYAVIRFIGYILPPLRRGKPEGYHAIIIRAWFEDYFYDLFGFKKKLIRKSGPWSVTRKRHEISK